MDNHQNSSSHIDQNVAARGHGAKYQIYSLRGTPSQKALLDYAAATTRLSRQKIIEYLVWPVLEKEYGHLVPLDQDGESS